MANLKINWHIFPFPNRVSRLFYLDLKCFQSAGDTDRFLGESHKDRPALRRQNLVPPPSLPGNLITETAGGFES